MSRKKVPALVCAVLLCAGIGLRIWSVNQSRLEIPVEHRGMSETIEMAGNFMNDNTENTDGYSINVEAAEIMDASEYLERYGKRDWDEKDISAGAKGDVLVLKYTVRNAGNDSGWLDMTMLMAIGASKNHFYKVDSDLWEISEPTLTQSAALVLKPDSTYTTYLPFSDIDSPELFDSMTDAQNYVRKAIDDRSFELFICNAPTRIAIDIDL